MKRRISTAKRIVAVALAATVAVSLTGCKKRKNNTNAASSDVTTSQSQAAVSGNAGSNCHTCTNGYARTDHRAR